MIDQRESRSSWESSNITRTSKPTKVEYSTTKPIKKSEVYHAYNLGIDNFKNARLDAFQACIPFICFNEIIYETNTGLIVKDCKYPELLNM